ncbi:hypothetical protein F1880_001266 [Penicillium rolfsii]|nr:hypothetical protein F1880_001266 [Penicillium rolfsii]
MRWTPLADQMLLLKLIETHEINIDTTKIADAWPASLGGEAPPTARAVKERLSKIRELIKQSAGTTSVSSPAEKRGRVKKNTSAKSTSGTKAPARPRKTKQQSTVAVKAEQLSLDDADHGDEMDDLLKYPLYTSQVEDTEFSDIPDYSTQAPDAKGTVPGCHNNHPHECDEEV